MFVCHYPEKFMMTNITICLQRAYHAILMREEMDEMIWWTNKNNGVPILHKCVHIFNSSHTSVADLNKITVLPLSTPTPHWVCARPAIRPANGVRRAPVHSWFLNRSQPVVTIITRNKLSMMKRVVFTHCIFLLNQMIALLFVYNLQMMQTLFHIMIENARLSWIGLIRFDVLFSLLEWSF